MKLSDVNVYWRRRAVVAAIALVLVLGVVYVATCRSGGSAVRTTVTTSTSTTAPSTTTTAEPPMDAGTRAYVYSPHAGDCVDLRNLDTGATTAAVPGHDGTPHGDKEVILRLDCSAPHQYEVIGVVDVPDPPAAYPAEDELAAVAKKLCPPLFPSYVGRPYETSKLELGWIFPKPDQWHPGAQRIACTAYEAGGKLVGSVQGSNR